MMLASAMSVIGEVFFGGLGILVALGFVVRSISKSTQKIQGKHLCRFCRKRLKFDDRNVKYATVCPHCGRSQTA